MCDSCISLWAPLHRLSFSSSQPLAAGETRKWAHWEGSYYAIWAAIVLATVAYYNIPNTNPADWARDEAEERIRRRIQGLPVEYGVNYAALRFMAERQEDLERQ